MAGEIKSKKPGICGFPLGVFAFILAFIAPCSGQNAIQEIIDGALTAGATQVTVPIGIYRVSEPLQIDNVQNFTINAADVVMLLETRTRAINIANSTGLTLTGMTIDHAPLPHTQGTITAHAPDWSTIDVSLHEGYPTDPKDDNKVEVYDGETGRLIPGVWTLYGAGVEQLTGNSIRVTGTSGYSGKVNIGDKITLDCPNGLPHAVVIDKCTGCVFENMTLHTSTTFGFFETNGHGNRYSGIKIIPGLPPVAGGEPRLKSTNADGIHSKYATLGPLIENSTIIATGDDGVAINGDFDVLLESTGNVIKIAVKRSNEIEMGDTLRAFNPEGGLLFEAQVEAVSSVAGGDVGPLQTLLATVELADAGLYNDFYQLTLSQPVQAQVGAPVCAVNRKGNGFIVRNNYIGNKRARGILIKAESGVVEGNTIEWNHMGAIVFAPELNWMESGFSRSLKITGNIIRNSGLNPGNQGTVQAGIITVSAEGSSGFAPAGGHVDIEISGNRIDSSLGVNILATSVRGLSITDNMLSNTHTEPRAHGQNLGVNSESVIWIANCDEVTLSGNIVQGFGGEVLLETANVTGLVGGDDGIVEGIVGVGQVGNNYLQYSDPVLVYRRGRILIVTPHLSHSRINKNYYNATGRRLP